jgi:4-diphosphocytidyl-2-C-methyl-D-erythritol kinase
VTGVGEVVEPLAFEAGLTYTLLTPPFGVSTEAVYRAWDDLGGPHGDGPNDLEVAALTVEPSLAAWRDRLGEATGVTPALAGSGSTWWVPGDFPDVEGAVVVRTARP